MPVDGFVLVETEHVLHQRFVEVVLHLVNQQVKPIAQRRGHQRIEEQALGGSAGEKIYQFLVGDKLLPGVVTVSEAVVVIVHHLQTGDVGIKDLKNRGERIRGDAVLFQCLKCTLIRIHAFAVAAKIHGAGFFLFEDKEHDRGVLRQLSNIGYRLEAIVVIDGIDVGLAVFFPQELLIYKAGAAAEGRPGTKSGGVAVDIALVVKRNFQVDAVIVVMPVFKGEVAQDRIAAVQQVHSRGLTGGVLSHNGHGVLGIKPVSDFLQLVLLVLGGLPGLGQQIYGKMVAGILKMTGSNAKQFHCNHLWN